MQDKLAEAQRKGLDLNDQVQLCRDQLEATKVLYCSMQCFVCGVCVCACVCVRVCVTSSDGKVEA